MRHEDDTLGPSSAGGSALGQSEPPTTGASSSGAPKTLGRYDLLGVLGEGGMGVVHLAHDRELDRQVALKLLHSGVGARRAERFVREARALARLSHPNVVQVFEVGQHDERWLIAMELVRGRTLRQWQANRPPWRECVRVYRQAGRGLAAAHAAGLTHRDFKPGNCILDDEGRVRVLDFGLARHGENDSLATPSGSSVPSSDEPVTGSLTRTGEVLGTLGYMPLEQLGGRRADALSDQWSFCASLYEALYGERPIAADTVGTLTVALMKERIRDAPAGSSVPRRLRRVLLRGLAKAPEDRWPSMDALLDALTRLETRRTRWTLGAGMVLVAMVGVSLSLLPSRSPSVTIPPEPTAAPERSGPSMPSPSPEAVELRKWAEATYAAHDQQALGDRLEQLAPAGELPDDDSLAAEVLLWKGRLHEDPRQAETLLRSAYFMAQQADLPSIEARAAGSLADNPFGAHAEGVAEWTRLAWVAVERVPWDRSAAIEIAVTVANATSQVWWIMGKEHTRAVLEFADDTVGDLTLQDDAFVAWQLAVLSSAWRQLGETERALHWGIQARTLLGGVVDPLHPQWGDANEHIGRALVGAGPHRCGEALTYLEEALATHLRHHYGEIASMVRLEITQCLRHLDQPEAAAEHARRAAEHWAEHPPKFMTNLQRAHLLAAYSLEDLGRIDEAKAELQHLLTLVDLDSSTDVVRDEAKQALARLEGGDERSAGGPGPRPPAP